MTDRIDDALRYVPVDDRDAWVAAGMAIKSELGDEGFAVWDSWSQESDTYNANDAKATWRSIRPGGGITIASLYFMAKEHGWTPTNGMYQAPSPEETAARKRLAEERRAREEAEIAREAAETARKAIAVWKAAKAAGTDHPYLVRKKVKPTATLREIPAAMAGRLLGYPPKSGGSILSGRLLAAPVKRGDSLATLELIDQNGHKAALAGRGSKAGGFWASGPMPSGDGMTLILAEGVATTLTCAQATEKTGIAALSAGNLLAVARHLRQTYPKVKIVVAADVLKTTGEPDPHAVAAAQEVGGLLAVPGFGPDRDGQTDFNDLACLHGLEAVKAALGAATRVTTKETQEDASEGLVGGLAWPEPQPLTARITPEPYPVDALPATLRLAIEEVGAFVQAPMPLIAASALGALSLAAQAHVDIERATKLKGPVSLYMLTIADSGERKSTADGFFTAPIKEYEAQQRELMKPDIERFEAEMMAWTSEREGILQSIKQAAFKEKPTAELRATLAEHQLLKPVPPRVPRLLVNDETQENLAFGLAKIWPSSAVVSAEAGVVLGGAAMARDSMMRSLAFLNLCWDGASFSVGRRSSESFVVQGARLSVSLQIQEPALRAFFEKSGELARGSGFLARFLLSWPESTQGSRAFVEAPQHWPRLAAYHRRIADLLNHPAPMDENGSLSPAVMTLSAAAKQCWVEYHDVIEAELVSGGELHDVRDIAAKSADCAARLAALFEVFENGFGGTVSQESFESASRIAAWHLSESRRFFGELALPIEMSDAIKLDSWLIEHCHRTNSTVVAKNHVRQHGPLRNGARLDAAIRELVDHDRLRIIKDKRLTLHLNPVLGR